MSRELFITVDTQVDTIESPHSDYDKTNIITEIKYHKYTKVMYMFVSSSKNLPHNITGISVSPMYDADGSLMIYDEVKYKTEKLIEEIKEKVEEASCIIYYMLDDVKLLSARNLYVKIVELKKQVEEDGFVLEEDLSLNIDVLKKELKKFKVKV